MEVARNIEKSQNYYQRKRHIDLIYQVLEQEIIWEWHKPYQCGLELRGEQSNIEIVEKFESYMAILWIHSGRFIGIYVSQNSSAFERFPVE